MALNTQSPDNVLYNVDPPPISGTLANVLAWANREFLKLASFFTRPSFPVIVLVRIDSVLDPNFKAQDGMLAYVGPGVLGPQEGLYIREQSVWKKIAGT
jgi:hypothetical protein